MICRPRAVTSALVLAALLASSTSLLAASTNYGNFAIPSQGLTFQNVIESSGTDASPLFGPPTPYVVGLDFDPTAFTAASSGGGADLTDGQLNFSIQAEPGQAVGTVAITEGGLYNLLGAGSAATQVFAGVNLSVTVTEIDGVAIAPVNLTSVNAWLNKNLLANPGLSQTWTLNAAMPVTAELVNLGYVFNVGASRIEVVIDNSLAALSEAVSIASISKTDFVVDITPDPNGFPSPEPASSVLALAAVAGVRALRRKK